MLAISRAGYHFGFSEMMRMPIRFLKKFEDLSNRVLEKEQEAYNKK